MANITTQQPIRYAIDTLNTASFGVAISKTSGILDCTEAAKVNSFAISYDQPEGSNIYVMFKSTDNSNWFRLNTTGQAENKITTTPSYEYLTVNGNTISELNALKDIPAFAGKKIMSAIALDTTDLTYKAPRIKLGVKCTSKTETLTTTQYSQVYTLGEKSRITKIDPSTIISGKGNVKVYAQMTRDDGTLSEWIEASNVSGETCQSVQLRGDYSVSNVGSDSAQIESVKIIYSDSSEAIAGAESGEIISLTEDWYIDVKRVRMNIRHSDLDDAVMRAYVCFRKRPVLIQGEQLGVGDGGERTYQLSHKNCIKYDSIRLYFNNNRVYGNFDFNADVGRLTCTAPYGVVITCDYESDWGLETWQQMTLTERYSLNDYDVSEYRYAREDSNEAMSVCAVKIVLENTTGTITKESIGTGTGKQRTYRLKKHIKDGKITIYSNGSKLSSGAYVIQDDTQYIKIAASNGQKLTADYTWISRSPVVYQFAAVFAE